MEAKSGKSPNAKPASDGSGQVHSFWLLKLPVVLLHLVLGLLGPCDLAKLLQSSKAMAREVMQHKAGRLTLKLNRRKGFRLAAIRQVLQWAPPSTIKLMLDGLHLAGTQYDLSDWDILSRLFNVHGNAVPSPNGHQRQHMQQLPCVLEVCIQGFALPSLVPTDLAASCPNMRSLHLCCCEAAHSRSSQGRGGSSSSSSISTLEISDVSCMIATPLGETSEARSMQLTAQHVAQLHHSLPNVTCLKLQHSPVTVELLSTVGPQLAELHLSKLLRLPSRALGTHLQQLKKLVLPDADISVEGDMGQLLSLPRLTHLEVEKLSYGAYNDYSNHPCKWQYLQFHLCTRGLCADVLAMLPLHSLTHPLVLGHEEDDCVLFRLEPTLDPCELASLERLAHQLRRCGVQLLAPRVAWGHSFNFMMLLGFPAELLGPALMPAFKVIAPAIGLSERVVVTDRCIYRSTLKAFATVYGSGLKWLGLDNCIFDDDMLPLWQAALSALPAMEGMEVVRCFRATTARASKAEATRVVRQLAVAVAHQPAGRSVEFLAWLERADFSSQELATSVVKGAGRSLAGVHVGAVGAGGEVRLRITNQPRLWFSSA